MKKLDQLKPDDVLAAIKGEIRRRHGDEVENSSTVYATRGWYYIILRDFGMTKAIDSGALRRSQIGKWLKEQKV